MAGKSPFVKQNLVFGSYSCIFPQKSQIDVKMVRILSNVVGETQFEALVEPNSKTCLVFQRAFFDLFFETHAQRKCSVINHIGADYSSQTRYDFYRHNPQPYNKNTSSPTHA